MIMTLFRSGFLNSFNETIFCAGGRIGVLLINDTVSHELYTSLNPLMPKKNGGHVADDDNSIFVQINSQCRTGDKSLPDPMLTKIYEIISLP